MYPLSLSMTGLTPSAASAWPPAALAASTPGGIAVVANASPAGSSRLRRVRIAPPLPATLSLPPPPTMCVLLLRALRACLHLLGVGRTQRTHPLHSSYVMNRFKYMKTTVIL